MRLRLNQNEIGERNMATLLNRTMDVSFVIEGYDNMINVDVTYTYYKGMPATDVEPAEPPSAEIKTVTWNGMGIAVLLEAVDPQIIRDLEQRIVDEE